jgi:hypothetical protein
MNETNLLTKSVYLMISPINNFINYIHEKYLILFSKTKNKRRLTIVIFQE